MYHASGGKHQFPANARRCNWKGKHLILVILAVFVVIFLGCVYYLPEVMPDSEDHDRVSERLKTAPPVNHDDGAKDKEQDDEVVYIMDIDDVAEAKLRIENVEDVKKDPVSVQTEEKQVIVDSPNERNYEAIDPGDSDPTASKRREKVKEIMLHSWNNYVKYAWGQNELKPLSKSGHSAGIFGQSALGATIIDGADTLYIMGLHEEYKMAREWIAHSFDFKSASTDVSVFEINIRFVGGLLSLYALTKDEVYKIKAVQIVDKLLPAFNTPTGIPNAILNLKTGSSHNWGWASGGCSILAEFGTFHLEFQYLTSITENPIYLQKVQRIRQVLQDVEKHDGLYFNYLNPRTGNWGSRHVSMGALGDSFFEYLIKSWVGTSEKDVQAKEMYFSTIKAIEHTMLKRSANDLAYIGNYKNGRIEPGMDHFACFAGGMFALSSLHISDPEEREHHLKIGADLTNTCHESYVSTATHIGPDTFSFGSDKTMAIIGKSKGYYMRPETVESYFILWRVTHDNKYREWAWDAIQAIDKYCRVETGFCGLKDVYDQRSPKDDVQQSFFLAETLKYLYLIFCDDSLISLDKWVFNTEAHPLPILPDVPSISK